MAIQPLSGPSESGWFLLDAFFLGSFGFTAFLYHGSGQLARPLERSSELCSPNQCSKCCTKYGTLLPVAKSKMKRPAPKAEAAVRQKRIPAIFFRTEAGGEPVREWLKSLSREDRKQVTTDIMTVEFGWPIGMPVCRPLGHGLYEVRTSLSTNRIARVLFYVDRHGRMVLLHGFIKKTQKTPAEDLGLAARNKSKHERGLK